MYLVMKQLHISYITLNHEFASVYFVVIFQILNIISLVGNILMSLSLVSFVYFSYFIPSLSVDVLPLLHLAPFQVSYD